MKLWIQMVVKTAPSFSTFRIRTEKSVLRWMRTKSTLCSYMGSKCPKSVVFCTVLCLDCVVYYIKLSFISHARPSPAQHGSVLGEKTCFRAPDGAQLAHADVGPRTRTRSKTTRLPERCHRIRSLGFGLGQRLATLNRNLSARMQSKGGGFLTRWTLQF